MKPEQGRGMICRAPARVGRREPRCRNGIRVRDAQLALIWCLVGHRDL